MQSFKVFIVGLVLLVLVLTFFLLNDVGNSAAAAITLREFLRQQEEEILKRRGSVVVNVSDDVNNDHFMLSDGHDNTCRLVDQKNKILLISTTMKDDEVCKELEVVPDKSVEDPSLQSSFSGEKRLTDGDTYDKLDKGLIIKVSHQEGTGKGTSTADSSHYYELLEHIHAELGLEDFHHIDFAYRPAVGARSRTRYATMLNSAVSDSSIQPLVPNKWPVFTSTSDILTSTLSNLFNAPLKKGGEYVRVGETAFAGGSFGEVWFARRRCNLANNNNNIYTECDENQKLVMKRLNLSRGIHLTEAALREIYFGEKLSKEGDSKYFAQYVDHFYRTQNGFLELWIVYEYAGKSLRNFLYTPVQSDDFIVYQTSSFWRKLRIGVYEKGLKVHNQVSIYEPVQRSKSYSKRDSGEVEGRLLIKKVLRQLLSAAEVLHKQGIVHRDIKPSNIMCKAEGISDNIGTIIVDDNIRSVHCVLGDFSSAYDQYTSRTLYRDGPSTQEQTDEYAPPEVLFAQDFWKPFDYRRPQSFDSWSIGVVALEMLLGTPNVFSVDQRTTTILTNKLRKNHSSVDDLQRALYLAALSQFCIFVPIHEVEKSWPVQSKKVNVEEPSCTLQDFHNALRARDPLGIGFDSSSDKLLELIWGLLSWDPMERLTPSQALSHRYFDENETSALVHQELKPEMAKRSNIPILEQYRCKCGKVFDNINSCLVHSRSRRHGEFCFYDRSKLPPCLSSHPILPSHPTSGYCDIQGHRKTIEDFHAIVLQPHHQFYGVFDGHNGNLCSKYVSSSLYKKLYQRIRDIDSVKSGPSWKTSLEIKIEETFEEIHNDFLQIALSAPGGVMSKSGTTATFLYLNEEIFIVANVGDSRALMSNGYSVLQLTNDHIASDPFEQELVVKRGGFVSSAGGIGRVNGTLAISRSIGDIHLHEFLSRKPHVVAMTRKEAMESFGTIEGNNSKKTCFVVLASDGLWDVMNNEEVVGMVRDTIENAGTSHTAAEGGVYQEAAERLTHEALVRGSSDNIGVCVVALEERA